MRVVTWAMQGIPAFGQSKWRSDVSRLFHAGAEIVCLQECGEPPSAAVPAAPPPWLPGFANPPDGQAWQYYLWNLGTERRPHFVNVLWMETDPFSHRSNLAVAFSSASVAALQLIRLPPGLAGKRPGLGVRVSYGGAPLDLYTLHTISPGGADTTGLVQHLLATGASNWFAAGILHLPPENLAGLLPPAAVVCPHNGASAHPGGGTNLAYAIKSAAGGATGGTVLAGFVVADHAPISYLL